MRRGCAQVMDRMRTTLFCLVLPGDSASARRTSEIFMSGCIPVFLGPPYGAMPLADGGIDYRASSLFFNVTEYRWRLVSSHMHFFLHELSSACMLCLCFCLHACAAQVTSQHVPCRTVSLRAGSLHAQPRSTGLRNSLLFKTHYRYLI